MTTLPSNWQEALQRIAETATPVLREAVFVMSPVGWKRREMVKYRFKRPELIVQCFEFWLDGQQPIPNCPLANVASDLSTGATAKGD